MQPSQIIKAAQLQECYDLLAHGETKELKAKIAELETELNIAPKKAKKQKAEDVLGTV